MRALLVTLVLAGSTYAHAEPLSLRHAPAHVEVAAPRETAAPATLRPTARAERRVILTVALGEREHARLPAHTRPPAGPTLMEQLRERIYEELPVVSTAVLAPLPIASANGTLAGVGVLGKF